MDLFARLYRDVQSMKHKIGIFIQCIKGVTETEGLEGQDAAENIWTWKWEVTGGWRKLYD